MGLLCAPGEGAFGAFAQPGNPKIPFTAALQTDSGVSDICPRSLQRKEDSTPPLTHTDSTGALLCVNGPFRIHSDPFSGRIRLGGEGGRPRSGSLERREPMVWESPEAAGTAKTFVISDTRFLL